jgi:isoaspartyl peptidase/L-asparaginase-like protein (Ntn-hydrolase superfamily)
MRVLSCALALLAAAVLCGCGDTRETPAGDREVVLLAGERVPHGALAVTHGGVGSPPTWTEDVQRAADEAAAETATTEDALAGALVGTVILEDNPLLNAGTGANIRLDGRTIQMDAALMTSDGEFAAVAVIERVRNPILVARAVLDTPHRLLAGDGATRFAHAMGFADEVPVCEQAAAKYRQRIADLLHGRAKGGYEDFDWRRAWNFPGPPPSLPGDDEEAAPGHPLPPRPRYDTVGTVTRAPDGTFAATLSTGGTSITLDGRVGDVPIYGCGCYAGPAGAVACTGFGEEIVRAAMARTVYAWMETGLTAREAVARGVAGFPAGWSLGLIAVGRDGWGVAATEEMAHGVAVGPAE